MTALSSEDQRRRGEQLGADRYLVKSQVGIEDVVRTIHDVLGDLPAAPAPTPQQTFGIPKPTAAVQPPSNTKTEAPRRVDTTLTPSQRPQQHPTTAAIVQSAPASSPAAAPQQPPAVQQPPTPDLTPPASESRSLPQPTAPFSSPRPASLGERIIHPLRSPTTPSQDMNSLMEKELAGEVPPADGPNPPPPPPPSPPAPPPPPTQQNVL